MTGLLESLAWLLIEIGDLLPFPNPLYRWGAELYRIADQDSELPL